MNSLISRQKSSIINFFCHFSSLILLNLYFSSQRTIFICISYSFSLFIHLFYMHYFALWQTAKQQQLLWCFNAAYFASVNKHRSGFIHHVKTPPNPWSESSFSPTCSYKPQHSTSEVSFKELEGKRTGKKILEWVPTISNRCLT